MKRFKQVLTVVALTCLATAVLAAGLPRVRGNRLDNRVDLLQINMNLIQDGSADITTRTFTVLDSYTVQTNMTVGGILTVNGTSISGDGVTIVTNIATYYGGAMELTGDISADDVVLGGNLTGDNANIITNFASVEAGAYFVGGVGGLASSTFTNNVGGSITIVGGFITAQSP